MKLPKIFKKSCDCTGECERNRLSLKSMERILTSLCDSFADTKRLLDDQLRFNKEMLAYTATLQNDIKTLKSDMKKKGKKTL